MKVCFVNVAFGGWYPRGQERLRKQCEANGIEFVGFGNYRPDFEAAKMHYDLGPYSFKPRAIKMAHEQTGADLVIWADSSVVIAEPNELPDFFERVAKAGVWAQYGANYLGSWCNENALRIMGLTREQAMKIFLPIAGLVGFNMERPDAMELLSMWQHHGEKLGTFKGSYTDHRHDQTVLGWLMHYRGFPLESSEHKCVGYDKGSGCTFDLYPVEDACALS